MRTPSRARLLVNCAILSNRPGLPEPKADGILLIHKPANWTSFDVIAKLRNTMEIDLKKKKNIQFSRKKRLKVGHGGTLDPYAEGLLVVGVGKYTKLMHNYMKGSKAYRATALLGHETDTQDLTGVQTTMKPTDHVTLDMLREAALNFVGNISQTPPAFSALKRGGKPMYALAREGKLRESDIEPRTVSVERLQITNFNSKTGAFEFDVVCGGGTYVRTLAVDLARRVHSAAHITSLLRTQVGPFRLEVAGEGHGEPVDPLLVDEFGDAERIYESMYKTEELLNLNVNSE